MSVVKNEQSRNNKAHLKPPIKTQTRVILNQEKKEYDQLVSHPLQSWAWGNFRQKMHIKVIRLGQFKNNSLILAYQVFIHRLPHSPFNIGYLPKGPLPNPQMIKTLKKIGQKNKCIFIKLEPNIPANQFAVRPQRLNLVASPHPLFTKYTFQIELTKSPNDLLANMHSKTRYNIRLSQKKGVVVTEDNSLSAFKAYLKLLQETTKRQNFLAHNQHYQTLMFNTLRSNKIAHLLIAKYHNIPLAAWILFEFNNVLYYPYGASSNQHRNLMASNLMMWEAIRLGQKKGLKTFDLWGCLGPKAKANDPWFGFHRFKLGFGPKLIELAGSWDLIIRPQYYQAYNVIHPLYFKTLKYINKLKTIKLNKIQTLFK